MSTSGNIMSTSGNIMSTSGNIMSTSGDIMSTSGDIMSTSGNIMSTSGNIMSTSGDIMSTSGDIMSTSGNIMSTSGGYHEYIWGISCVHLSMCRIHISSVLKLLTGSNYPINVGILPAFDNTFAVNCYAYRTFEKNTTLYIDVNTFVAFLVKHPQRTEA